MPDNAATSKTVPTPQEVSNLKRLAAGIIRAQGNRFIKELMRSKGILLGTNKADFELNLTAAIEAGDLVLDDVDLWLRDVEGWGNQHVYLYALPPAITQNLTKPRLRQSVSDAGFDHLWDAPTVLTFPEKPELTSISFNDRALRLVWQEASPGWAPVPDKNITKDEGLDTYEYRAFRKVERRTVSRFEAHKDRGLAALFIADPIQGGEHDEAVAEAKRVIGQLIDLPALETNQFDISMVSRDMDQLNVPSNTNPDPSIKTQKTRLSSGGSYVEFAANSKDNGYADENAVRDVRKSITLPQLPAFKGATGVFVFQPGTGTEELKRPLRVQLYSKGNRIRLWAQMEAEEVWRILSKISAYRNLS